MTLLSSKYTYFLFLTIVALEFAGCSPRPSTQGTKNGFSHLDFNATSGDYTGLVSKLKQPRLTACISGISSMSKLEWQIRIQNSIMAWVDVLRTETTDKLVEEIEVVLNGTNCDTTIVASPGAWAMTQMTDNPRVTVATEGYFASDNVVMHEFGHAFGLYDTYMNGQSGNCQPGQPQAVMCNTSFKEPQSDDIAGVKTIFKRAFPNDTPNPNQTLTSSDPKIKMRLKDGASFSVASVDFAVETARKGTLSYCMNTRDTCVQANSWQEAVVGTENGNIKFFASQADVSISDGKNLTARFVDSSGVPTFQAVKFKSIVN